MNAHHNVHRALVEKTSKIIVERGEQSTYFLLAVETFFVLGQLSERVHRIDLGGGFHFLFIKTNNNLSARAYPEFSLKNG